MNDDDRRLVDDLRVPDVKVLDPGRVVWELWRAVNLMGSQAEIEDGFSKVPPVGGEPRTDRKKIQA